MPSKGQSSMRFGVIQWLRDKLQIIGSAKETEGIALRVPITAAAIWFLRSVALVLPGGTRARAGSSAGSPEPRTVRRSFAPRASPWHTRATMCFAPWRPMPARASTAFRSTAALRGTSSSCSFRRNLLGIPVDQTESVEHDRSRRCLSCRLGGWLLGGSRGTAPEPRLRKALHAPDERGRPRPQSCWLARCRCPRPQHARVINLAHRYRRARRVDSKSCNSYCTIP